MTPPQGAQRSLRMVGHAADATTTHERQRHFCGHCGREPAETPEGPASTRVCGHCGLGIVLSAPGDVAPGPKDPFLVIDGSMNVCAVSRDAERLLDVSEAEAINHHLSDYLEPGDAEAEGPHNLGALLAWAARGDAPARSIVVRPSNVFGVRYWARIGPCGPPPAALMVLADAS